MNLIFQKNGGMSQSHNAPPSPVLHKLLHSSDQFGVVSVDIDGVESSLSIGTVAPVVDTDFCNVVSIVVFLIFL